MESDANRDSFDFRIALHAAPVFRSSSALLFSVSGILTLCTVDTMGVVAFVSTVASGMSLGVFPPSDPPVVPSPENYLTSATATKCDILFTVPRFLELWAPQEQDVNVLKTFKMVTFGGGPLGHDAGQRLVDHGVKLVNYYGTTEIGVTIPYFYGTSPKFIERELILMHGIAPYPDWEWITLAKKANIYYRHIEGEANQFELVYLVCSMLCGMR